jgi:hypothetical protein
MNEMVNRIWKYIRVITVTVTAIGYSEVLRAILAVASTAPACRGIVTRSPS